MDSRGGTVCVVGKVKDEGGMMKDERNFGIL
jgi:hypothetical protein